jgi:hypothetical protein
MIVRLHLTLLPEICVFDIGFCDLTDNCYYLPKNKQPALQQQGILEI